MRRLLFLFVVLSLLAIPAVAAAEDPEPPFLLMEVEPVEVRLGESDGVLHHRREDPLPFQRSTLTSVSVTYKGAWPTQAKEAFEYALGLWEAQLNAAIPINVEANWKSLGTGVLGSAAPNGTYAQFPGARSEAYYPAPLANQLAGKDLDPKKPEIVANFSSRYAKEWYYGTDGRPPAGKVDFVSVILHEIAHGLGFSGSANVAGTNGMLGVPPKYTVGTIYDAYIVNGDGKPLMGTYKGKSPEMKTQLQSGVLYWSGAAGVSATPGTSPRLYAPNKWDSGSSVYHLDEALYPPGDPDSVMTPMQGDGEASHEIGPITRGILRDLGWAMAPTEPALLYFLEQPGGANPDELLTVQPKVAVLNAAGYTVVSDDDTVVTIELVDAPSAALTCDGGLTRKAKAGVATFSGCRISGTAVNARIVASGGALAPVESKPFIILKRGLNKGALPGVSHD